jgi:hypothetical protein
LYYKFALTRKRYSGEWCPKLNGRYPSMVFVMLVHRRQAARQPVRAFRMKYVEKVGTVRV